VDNVKTVEDLYGLDLGEFTAARDALSKQVRASGDSEAADVVKRLRRPSQTVWGLNQVARSDRELVNEALDAGRALRAATIKVLEGDRSALGAAQTEERRAVDAVVVAVGATLGSAGHRLSDAAAQRVAATIRAAFADAEVEAQLHSGTLTEEHAHAGFGLDPEASLPAPPPKPAQPTKTRRRQQEESTAANLAEEADRLATTARQLREAAVAAERTAAIARNESDRAEEAWKRAQRKADEAASALEKG
jgi:hypothetical protein